MELLLLGFFVLLNASSGLGIPGGRIVDGINAGYGEAAYAVSVRYNDFHECGGSIIGENWVLTAAHCVFIDFVNISTVLYGTKYIQDGVLVEGHTIKVKEAHVHENYQNYSGYFNDIALLERSIVALLNRQYQNVATYAGNFFAFFSDEVKFYLNTRMMEEPFVFSMGARPVTLPEQDVASPVSENALLVGWGYSHVNGTVATLLQKVDISIYPDETCVGYFNVTYSPISHICAGGNGKGQCTGDSGGALTVGQTQYGIVSWSDKPCATTPGVLTRVASFRNWISSISGI